MHGVTMKFMNSGLRFNSIVFVNCPCVST